MERRFENDAKTIGFSTFWGDHESVVRLEGTAQEQVLIQSSWESRLTFRTLNLGSRGSRLNFRTLNPEPLLPAERRGS